MEITKKELIFAIASASFSFLLLPCPLASCSSLAALCISRTPFLTALWSALACGLAIDLLASDLSFGLFSLVFTLSCAALWKKRLLFFPFFTFLFNLLVLALLCLLRVRVQISLSLLLFPPLYALFFLMLPLFLLHQRPSPAHTQPRRPQ